MSKMNTILSERLKNKEESPKMTILAQKSASGALTSFTGIFGTSDLSLPEKETLKELLEKYAPNNQKVEEDLKHLVSITLEVKSINNQAALLHGERIKKARDLLKSYKEGAFSSWLINVYGNRQTPYNFLQYYEFYSSVSKELHAIIDALPRQAIYSLASRDAPLHLKEKAIRSFPNKTKHEILMTIRKLFPLAEKDKRNGDDYAKLIMGLEKLQPFFKNTQFNKSQVRHIESILNAFYTILENKKKSL